MIPRYTRPEMGRIWSDENKFRQWLEVELAAAEALAELGVVPAEAARLLRAHAGFDVRRIHEIEREVKHDVIAFTTAVAETMAQCAMQRTESRGAHQRTDYPARDDEKFLAHSMAYRDADGRPRVEYAPVTITRWPPGERIYGR